MDVSGNISAILSQKGREIHSVSPTDSVFDAVSLLAEKNIGALLVMDGDNLVGMFSERDIMNRVVAVGRMPGQTRVSEVMTANPRCVKAMFKVLCGLPLSQR